MKKFIISVSCVLTICFVGLCGCDSGASGEAHRLVKIEAVAATCEDDGNTEYYRCTECGDIFADANGETELSDGEILVPATGHKYSEWSIEAESECATSGKKVHVCEYCGDKEEVDVFLEGHKYVDNVCTVCGDYYDLNFELNEEKTGYTLVWYGGETAELTIPSSYKGLPVTKIEAWAFALTKNALKSVVIPDSVTEIEEGTFKECENLESATIGGGLKKLPEELFSLSQKLTNVTISKGTEEIGDNCFQGCSALESVTLPDGLLKIGALVFYNCTSITEVVLPDTVKEIGQQCFGKCSLISFDTGSGLEKIGNAALFQNEKIESVVIGENVTEIAKDAFQLCSGLKTVSFSDTSGWKYCYYSEWKDLSESDFADGQKIIWVLQGCYAMKKG